LLKYKVTKSRIQPFNLRQLFEIFEGKGFNQLKAKVKKLRNYSKTHNLPKESNLILISQIQELEILVSSLESSKPPNQSSPSSPKFSPKINIMKHSFQSLTLLIFNYGMFLLLL